jgi:hypothetical protein
MESPSNRTSFRWEYVLVFLKALGISRDNADITATHSSSSMASGHPGRRRPSAVLEKFYLARGRKAKGGTSAPFPKN